MTEPAGVAADTPPVLRAAVQTVAARWQLVLAVTLSAVALTVAYLHLATPRYTAELRVHAAPSAAGRTPGLGSNLAALAGVGAATNESNPYRLFLDAVYSPEVAARLATDPALLRGAFPGEWQDGRWVEPSGIVRTLRKTVGGVLGLPPPRWQPPGTVRLNDWIGRNVDVRVSVKSPVAVISLAHPDPAFARVFVSRLGAASDAFLREQQRRRADTNTEFLADRLDNVGPIDQRQALLTALVEQERMVMLAGSHAGYAAEAFGPATVSSEPTSPRSGALLIGGLVAGLVLGVAAALYRGAPTARPH